MNFNIQHVTKTFTAASACQEDFSTRIRGEHHIAPVEIDVEVLTIPHASGHHTVMKRPIGVRGVVFPIATAQRKETPGPLAFDSLEHYIQSVTQRRIFRVLSPDSDRGHVFALELGGPQSNHNIIPQWGGFQQNGDWRRFEKQVRTHAVDLMSHQNSVFLEFHIEYLNLEMHHHQDVLKDIFLFHDKGEALEVHAKKCLQIFGIPTAYSFQSHPCALLVQRPRSHGLSMPYIKYLSQISHSVWQDPSALPIEQKIRKAQMPLRAAWGLRKVAPTQLLTYDPRLVKKMEGFSLSGRFDLSGVTEEDLVPATSASA